VPETAGGSGGTLHDLAAILLATGRFAAPIPIAETAMLGGWLLAEARLALPEGPVTVVDRVAARQSGMIDIDATAAWARHAERIVALTADGRDPIVVSLRPDQMTITPGANLAGEARDRVVASVSLADVEHAAVDRQPIELERRGALSRVVLAAGALSAVAQMTVDYTNQRHQFGKPVASFQAVQHHLVTVSQSAVRARMAADIAVRALADGGGAMEIAAARVVTDDAITAGTRAAHQAHGAMGVTREYPLHQLTRRLWSWRHEWGTTTRWRRDVGHMAAAAGAEDLFGFATGGSDEWG
jgi:acyl-CoA dehydrogenase